MIALYGAQQWTQTMFGLAVVPPTFYIALLSDLPGDDWDGTTVQTLEPSSTVPDAAYARQGIATGGAGGWAQDENGYVYNNVDLVFPTPTDDWGTLSYFGVLDDAVAGNLWAADELVLDIQAAAGVPPLLPAGSLYFALGTQNASIEG